MSTRTLLLALAALACTPVARAADCTLTTKELKPQFAGKLPRGARLVSTAVDVKKKRTVTQTLRLPTGETVKLTLGGCERVTWSLAIEAPTITTRTVGAEAIAVSRRVLGQLPMRADAIVDVKRMLAALEEARLVALPSTLPCGNATCRLSIEPRPEPKSKRPKKAEKKDTKAGKKAAVEVAAGPEKKDDASDAPGFILLSFEGPEL